MVIFGKDLEWAREPLDTAGISIASGPDRLWGSLGKLLGRGGRMTVRLDANTPQEAEDRVREALPDFGYTIGQVKPLGP